MASVAATGRRRLPSQARLAPGDQYHAPLGKQPGGGPADASAGPRDDHGLLLHLRPPSWLAHVRLTALPGLDRVNQEGGRLSRGESVAAIRIP
jgi:hypothetical protein